MAVNLETLGAGGPAIPARPIALPSARTRRRIAVDRWASRLVIVGGIIVIASILGILLVILGETWPLFRAPSARLLTTLPIDPAAVSSVPPGTEGFDVDGYRWAAFAPGGEGTVQFHSLRAGRPIPPVAVPGLDGARVTAATGTGKGRFLVGTSDGRVLPIEVGYAVTFGATGRVVTPKVTFGEAVTVDAESRRPIRHVAAAATDSGPVTVVQVGPAELILHTVQQRKALVGPGRREESPQTLMPTIEGEITALRLDGRSDDLFLGTSRGQVVRYDLRERTNPALAETVEVSAARGPVRVLGFLIGDRTLVTGDE